MKLAAGSTTLSSSCLMPSTSFSPLLPTFYQAPLFTVPLTTVFNIIYWSSWGRKWLSHVSPVYSFTFFLPDWMFRLFEDCHFLFESWRAMAISSHFLIIAKGHLIASPVWCLEDFSGGIIQSRKGRVEHGRRRRQSLFFFVVVMFR